MKGLATLTAVVGLACMAGCELAPGYPQDKSLTNEWLVRSYSDDAINNAVIAQHTLYPYHFHKNGAALNELGEYDLAVLVNHFKDHPGRLNVRQGDESTKLHAARINMVMAALRKGGVEASRIEFTDAIPGGDGMASERVVKILEKQPPREPASRAPTRTMGVSSQAGAE
jgi:hypothetical protein